MNNATHYQFLAANGTKVIVRRGESAPKMVGGGGSWELIERPRRVSITQWKGHEPFQMDVPILFDGWRMNDSQEEEIARLNQMQMSPSDLIPPPTVKIVGAVPIKGATWVITSIDWGDNVYWVANAGANPYRLRQDAVVHLMQFIHEDRLNVSPLKIIAGGTYTSKQGDTLRSIAKYWYGDAKKSTLIKQANPNIKDPNKIKTGTKIKMPADQNPTGSSNKRRQGTRK